MKQIIKRASDPTPKFFKKIIKIGLSVLTVGIAIKATPETVPGVVLPAIVNTISGYMIAAGSIAAALSKLTTTNEK